MANPTVMELNSINQKTQFVVFGFVRNAQNLLMPSSSAPTPVAGDAVTSDTDSRGSDAVNDEDGESTQHRLADDRPAANMYAVASVATSTASPTKIPEGVSLIVVSYYHDALLLRTNFLYSSWSDLGRICSAEEVRRIKAYRSELVAMGCDPRRLPLYELFRYYFGVSKDLSRAVNKWRGSIDTFSYYNLGAVTKQQTQRCFRALAKSCTFCGYHDVASGRPSPVFVLNYANFDWADFDHDNGLNALIKAAFYVCSWMTDSLDAMNHGVTLMVNARGVGFRDISKAMTLLRAVQKSLAMRTNNVFFLNLPSLAKSSMRLFLKIYPKHIQERLHLCSDTKSLRHILSDDKIPQIFGGTLDRNVGGSGQQIPSLGELLAAYAEIKDFDHLQSDDALGRY